MDAYLGEIRLFSQGGSISEGWLECNGQELKTVDYPGLATLIQGAFGKTDTTFKLPDLRGRTPIGVSKEYKIGAAGGVEQVALTEDSYTTHAHQIRVSSVEITTLSPSALGVADGTLGMLYSPVNPSKTSPRYLHADSVSSAGAGAPHNNMQPSLVLRFCIAIIGEYPQPSPADQK
jgi:microcystin-dependent protein